MDISEYINVATGFYRAHPLIAVVCGIFLFYLFYRKPKFFLSVLLLALILAVITHFILKAGSWRKKR